MSKAKQISKLSISVPMHFKPLIAQRAAELDLTVSQYIRRLVADEKGQHPLKADAKNDVITTYD